MARHEVLSRGSGTGLAEHQRKALKGIGKCSRTRHQIPVQCRAGSQHQSSRSRRFPRRPLRFGFLGLPYVFAGRSTLAKVTDRVSKAESRFLQDEHPFSTYEDHRISGQTLLFGFQPNIATRYLRSQQERCPSSSELTSISKLHSILQQIAHGLVRRSAGLLVELVNLAEEYATHQPFSNLQYPARRTMKHITSDFLLQRPRLPQRSDATVKSRFSQQLHRSSASTTGAWHLTGPHQRRYRVGSGAQEL